MRAELIIAVKRRPVLWDPNHKDHQNFNVVDKEWKAVAEELNTTDEKARQVWKNLLQEFLTQDRERSHSSSEQWVYFNSIGFLEESMGYPTLVKHDNRIDSDEPDTKVSKLVKEEVDSSSPINPPNKIKPDGTKPSFRYTVVYIFVIIVLYGFIILFTTVWQ